MKFNKKWLWLIIPILIFTLVCINSSSVSTVLLAIQGAITDGNLVKFSGTNGIGVDTGLSTTDVADAITKKHTQNTDNHLGTVDQDIPMNTHKFTGLSVPASNGDSIRATTKITEANLEDAVDKKHEHSNKTELDKVTDGDHDVRTDNPHAVTKTQVSLGNVTDDAQLKRVAGDINSFDEKTEPVANDLLLAEDSADSNNKKKVKMKYLLGGLVNQVLTSGTTISWDMKDGSRATLTAEHNFTITITKFATVLMAILVVTQDGTGNRVLDEIVTQKDEDIGTAEVHADTDIIDLSIDIPTGARIRFKTSAVDLPVPLVVDTIYYAIRTSENHIKVATSKANAFTGTAIDITDQGTGTHTVQQLVKWPGGSLGVLQTAAGGEDIVKLHYKTADEQWYAELISNFS